VLGREQIERVAEELFESWYSVLVGYATRSTGSLELAEDLVQEAFLALCHELARGAVIESPKGWTLCVIRHQISKHLRVTKDRGIVFEPLDAEGALLPQHRYPTAGTADPTAESDQISKLLGYLTEREEEVILLRLEGFQYREIARQLDIRVSSVKTFIARAIRKLRDVHRKSAEIINVVEKKRQTL
jgi:RNA polymerase sigma-70 factor (ECF subfamily)